MSDCVTNASQTGIYCAPVHFRASLVCLVLVWLGLFARSSVREDSGALVVVCLELTRCILLGDETQVRSKAASTAAAS